MSSLKGKLQNISSLRWVVRQCRKVARPSRFLVWHLPQKPFLEELLQKVRQNPGGPMLEVGSGTRRLHPDFINLELQYNKNVDVRGNARLLPFHDNMFALVWFEAALEHLSEPVAAVAEIERVLKPGGYVYVEVPFMQGYHADPGDYQRYTLEGLRKLFSKFELELLGPVSGPASAFCYMATSFFANLFSFGSRWLYKVGFHYIFCYLFFPFKYLDCLLIHYPEAHRTAFGYRLLGRKKIK